MCEDHKFVAGPKKARGTGLIYYLEKYESLTNIEEETKKDRKS